MSLGHELAEMALSSRPGEVETVGHGTMTTSDGPIYHDSWVGQCHPGHIGQFISALESASVAMKRTELLG